MVDYEKKQGAKEVLKGAGRFLSALGRAAAKKTGHLVERTEQLAGEVAEKAQPVLEQARIEGEKLLEQGREKAGVGYRVAVKVVKDGTKYVQSVIADANAQTAQANPEKYDQPPVEPQTPVQPVEPVIPVQPEAPKYTRRKRTPKNK